MSHKEDSIQYLREGAEAASKAQGHARNGNHQTADGYGMKAHGCFMQAQASATLALVEAQEHANELKRIETILGVLSFALRYDFDDAEWAIELGKQITADGGFSLTPRTRATLRIEVAE